MIIKTEEESPYNMKIYPYLRSNLSSLELERLKKLGIELQEGDLYIKVKTEIPDFPSHLPIRTLKDKEEIVLGGYLFKIVSITLIGHSLLNDQAIEFVKHINSK